MRNCTCPPRDDGISYNEFIAENFGECLYTTREIASFIVGMSSLGFWIACQVPQFIKNYQRKSGGALSKWFLLEWFLGDALNLLGAFLTHQLATQIATGILFIINDMLMISQITYYTFYGVKEKEQSPSGYEPLLEGENESSEENNSEFSDDEEQSSSSARVTALASLVVPVVAVALVNNNKLGANLTLTTLLADDVLTTDLPDCESHAQVPKNIQDLGMAIGWISSVVYLNSRIPQILKNQRRRSVEGLSIVMFSCAVMGNTTYGLGVLLRDSSWKAIKKALPWLVGSLGTLFLDFTILMQFWCFVEESGSVSQPVVTTTPRGSRIASFFHRSPDTRGLYGMKAWNTSPFFRPMSGTRQGLPPLNLRDAVSLGVLPSEVSAHREGEQSAATAATEGRARSGSH